MKWHRMPAYCGECRDKGSIRWFLRTNRMLLRWPDARSFTEAGFTFCRLNLARTVLSLHGREAGQLAGEIRRLKSGLRSRSAEQVGSLSMAFAAARSERLTRRRSRNFSRNRPETTNLNHQYAIRRVFIVPSSMWERGPDHFMDSAEACDRM
jgi:hypothetical protein